MPLKIDIRKDPFFAKGKAEGKAAGKAEGKAEGIEEGIEKGIEKKNRIFVTNLLEETDFSNEKIALMADVSVAFVKKIRKELGK